ncbi:Putative glycosyl transferase [Mycobacteroides abscessus]|nr:Putative glycosyl transferase [Mycobacteroides abscessus]
MLCWRDTAHPQGGGSETYLQRIGAELAASGVKVTLRCAAHPGAPRREVVERGPYLAGRRPFHGVPTGAAVVVGQSSGFGRAA